MKTIAHAIACITLSTLITETAYATPPMMGTSSTPNALAFKNGSTEVVTIHSNGTISGKNPTANAHLATKQYVDTQIASNSGDSSKGYFVLSNGQWNGNLGGLSGANAKCLSDLTANNWYGKTDATLNSSTVKAFLCDSSTCQNPQEYTRYQFAKSGDTTKGGAYFDTVRNGIGPNDTVRWHTSSYLGNTAYHSNRNDQSDTAWENEPSSSGNSCQNYTVSLTTQHTTIGSSANNDHQRWEYDFASRCSNMHYLVCMVHPQ